VAEELLFDGHVPVTDGPGPEQDLGAETPRKFTVPWRPLAGFGAGAAKVIHVEPTRLVLSAVQPDVRGDREGSPLSDDSQPQVQPPVKRSTLDADLDTADEADGHNTSEQPPKKRIRARRTVDEVRNAVVSNQAILNSNITELTKELKQRNAIAAQFNAEMLQLKREEIMKKDKQHEELVDSQTMISSALAEILFALKK
jgi:hypothetical protein